VNIVSCIFSNVPLYIDLSSAKWMIFVEASSKQQFMYIYCFVLSMIKSLQRVLLQNIPSSSTLNM